MENRKSHEAETKVFEVLEMEKEKRPNAKRIWPSSVKITDSMLSPELIISVGDDSKYGKIEGFLIRQTSMNGKGELLEAKRVENLYVEIDGKNFHVPEMYDIFI